MKNRFYLAIWLIFFTVALPVYSQSQIDRQLKQAGAWLRTGRLVRGERLLQKILTEQPHEKRAFQILIKFYLRQQAAFKAKELIDAWLQHNPADIDIYIHLVETYYQVDEEDAAQNLINNKILVPDVSLSLQNYLDLTRILQTNQQQELLLAVCERGINDFPKMAYFYQVKMAIYEMRGDFEKIIDESVRLLTNGNKQFRFVSGKILSLKVPESKKKMIIRQLQKFLQQKPHNLQLQRLLVEWYIHIGESDEAIRLIEKITDKALQANYLKIIALETSKKEGEAEAIRFLEKLDPKLQNQESIKIARLELYEMVARKKPTPKILDKVFRILQNWETKNRRRSELAERYLNIFVSSRFDLDKALILAKQMKKQSKNIYFKSRIDLVLAKIYRLKNNFQKSDSVLNSIKTPGVLRRKVQYELLRNLFFQCRIKEFNSFYEQYFSKTSLADTLANNHLRLRFLMQLTNGDSSVFSILAKAELLNYQANFSESNEFYKKLYSYSNKILSKIAAEKIAENYLTMGSAGKALEWYEKAIQMSEVLSDKSRLLLRKAEVLYELGHKDRAKKTYFEVLLNTPEGKWARISRIQLGKLEKEESLEN